MVKNLIGAAVFAGLIGISSAHVSAEEWKFAIEEIPGSIMDSYAQEFKKRIETATDGGVTVTIYHLGSLGTPTEVAEQTADGIVQLSNLSVGNLGTIVPESQILLMPYALPADGDDLSKMLSSSPTIYNELARDFEKSGLRLGALYSGGPMVWTTRKEIRTPEDLAGLKIRVMVSPLLLTAYEDLGADPTPISFGEVYGALQLGQIDGQINPIYANEEMKFYEVSDYLIWFGEQELITAVMTSDDWYQTLAPERQELLDEVLSEMNDFIMPVQKQFNSERLEKIRENRPAIELIELSEDERAPFRERAQKTIDAVNNILGPRGEELLQSLQAETER